MTYIEEQQLEKDNQQRPWISYSMNFKICQLPSISHSHLHLLNLSGEVIQQYIDTLCSTQKQSNLTNSLLQDIPVFNDHVSTKLEDWLTSIEMAAASPVRAEYGLPRQNQGV